MIVIQLFIIYLCISVLVLFLYRALNFPLDSVTTTWMSFAWPITLPVTIIFYLLRFFKFLRVPVREQILTIYNFYKELFKDIK